MSRIRAFTMIELLMVMLIIGIVMAIVIPALGGARQAARRTSTQQVMTNVDKAIGQFRLDANRAPGFFTPEEMGREGNMDYGLTAMENAMLDLIGGVVPEDETDGDELTIQIPTVDGVVNVDPDRATGAYYVPDSAFYRPMIEGQQVGSDDHIGQSDADRQLKDVVDAWGNPLLLWVENEFGPTKIENHLDFARMNSGVDGSNRSRFYWAPNAGFLRSASLGKGGQSQIEEYDGSLLREEDGLSVPLTMMGVLGHPSFPNDRDLNANQILATKARSGTIIHSAGTDGIYFGRRDRGARSIGSAEGEPILYGLNFKIGRMSNVDLIDDRGQITNDDRAMNFDDMLLSAGR